MCSLWEDLNFQPHQLMLLLTVMHLRESKAGSSQSNADMAKDTRLRPGDRAVMRGTLQEQTIALENGETTTVNHLYVTAIEVISRSKRTSITAYEKEKKA